MNNVVVLRLVIMTGSVSFITAAIFAVRMCIKKHLSSFFGSTETVAKTDKEKETIKRLIDEYKEGSL